MGLGWRMLGSPGVALYSTASLTDRGLFLPAPPPPPRAAGICYSDVTGPACHCRGTLVHCLALSEGLKLSEALSPCFSFLALDLGQTWFPL